MCLISEYWPVEEMEQWAGSWIALVSVALKFLHLEDAFIQGI